ncbi:MAG: AraC family transcriptional regulator [Fibrobacteria bacterium]|nr:AraC family transcriptional regulator [Fibrobacteria bacterium]
MNSSQSQKIKTDFFSQMRNHENLELLFNSMPHICFWIKNADFEFVFANTTVLNLFGCKSQEELAGKGDDYFFPQEVSHKIRQDDEAIISGNKIIRNRIEILPNSEGKVDWYSTNKIPLYGKNNKIIGITGTTRVIDNEQILDYTGIELSGIVGYIYNNFNKNIEIKELAKMSGYSVSQFENKFKNMLQISPIRFIINMRIKAACKELTGSNRSIFEISQAMGFYDQSTFTRQFKSCIGIVPSQYRLKYRKKN